MENKWEYDYSGTYPGSGGSNPTPASYTPIGPSGEPSMGAGADYTAPGYTMPGGPSAPMGGEPQPPRMKKRHPHLKKIGAGALALVLVAGVSFGGGTRASIWPIRPAAPASYIRAPIPPAPPPAPTPPLPMAWLA